MKYFTPELVLRLRSADEDVSEAANEELDAVRSAYWKRSQRIRKRLTAAHADQIEDHYALHDAKLLSIDLGQARPLVVLTLQLEGFAGKPGIVLEIKYQTVPGLAGAFVLRQHPELAENTSRPTVLHDEFDSENGHLTHSLLLTGMEIAIHFTSLQVRRPKEPVFPVEDMTRSLEMCWGEA